jgi:hypothetical protein
MLLSMLLQQQLQRVLAVQQGRRVSPSCQQQMLLLLLRA